MTHPGAVAMLDGVMIFGSLARMVPAPERPVRAPGRVRCATCGQRFPATFRVCPSDATPLGVRRKRDPLVGTVLAGTYRVVRRIATGGMGRIYEADHVRLDRRFAIKVIHDAFARNDAAVARFRREAAAAARIRSDHVVDVIDVLVVEDGRPCIVTELLAGEDLQRRLDRVGRLPADRAIEIARQVCRGLAAAHAVGVIHRDLKPSNVFLTAGADGREAAKILDFGVAKLRDAPDLTRTGALVGTPSYMAPEQARGAARADERADVYGVGAVLYRCVTGRPPYAGNDAAATVARVLSEEPERPRAIVKELDETLEAVLQRAMARDPRARPDGAIALERELGEVIGDHAPADRDAPGGARTPVVPHGGPASAASVARRARRSRPLSLGALTGLALVAFAGASAWLAELVRQVFDEPPSDVERALIGVVGAGAGATVAWTVGRAVRGRWRSAPAVAALGDRLGRSLVAACAVAGGVQLAWLTLASYASEPPGAPWIWAIPAAAAVAVVASRAGRSSPDA